MLGTRMPDFSAMAGNSEKHENSWISMRKLQNEKSFKQFVDRFRTEIVNILYFSSIFADFQASSGKSGIRIPSSERAYAVPKHTEELRSSVHFGLHLKQPILNLRQC